VRPDASYSRSTSACASLARSTIPRMDRWFRKTPYCQTFKDRHMLLRHESRKTGAESWHSGVGAGCQDAPRDACGS
jgi:hypothetical protein